MDCARQFYILTKKNFIIRKRHFVITGLELGVACLLSFGFLLTGSPKTLLRGVKNAEYFPPYRMDELVWRNKFMQTIYSGCEETCFIAYAPMSPENDKFMRSVLLKMINGEAKSLNLGIKSFANDEAIVESVNKNEYNDNANKIIIAVIIKEMNQEKFKYVIRQRNGDGVVTSPSSYYISGSNFASTAYSSFMYLQYWLDQAYVESISTETQKAKLNNIQVYAESFPHPEYSERLLNTSIFAYLISSSIVVGLLMFTTSFVLRIVQDKASGMRELLQTMGLKNSVNYCAWFFHGYIVLFIINIFYLVMLSVPHSMAPSSFLDSSNKFIAWIFLNLYSVSLLLFTLFTSIFFKKGVYAVLFTMTIHLVSFFGPFYSLDSLSDSYKFEISSLSSKLAMCLLPNAALYYGFKVIATLEIDGDMLQWHTMDKGIAMDGTFSMNDVFTAMVASWFIYVALIWYWDSVWPWQTGVPRPFNFFIKKSYWLGSKSENLDELKDLLHTNAGCNEDISPGCEVGIDIRNLTKEFKNGLSVKTAVDEVSLKLYKGQITVLLGHNGAGKTTTLSLITGMYSPTGGTVLINGYDVRKDLNLARKSMGYCPQSSIFFSELSVSQHLEFIATLKGHPRNMMDVEINQTLMLLNLINKKNMAVSTLSGGMKKKLSLAMALVGGTKVLLLDEPTSGLDTQARREMWDILKSLSKGRTILLTTHYMEEADALGDRIAIMADGNIFCSGSSFFLKNKFGVGYHLRMVTNKDFTIKNVMKLINEFVQATIERNYGREISIIITGKTTKNFPLMFEKLEESKEELGIESFGLSVTNMEDVFLRVGEITAKQSESTSRNVVQRSTSMERDVLTARSKVHHPKLWLWQFYALVCKRFNFHRRQFSIFLLQLIVPTITAVLMVMILNGIGRDSSNRHTSLKLDLHDIYPASKSLVHYNDSTAHAVYEKLLKKDDVAIEETNDIQKRMIEIGRGSMSRYKYRYAVGMDFNIPADGNRRMIAYSNVFATHSPAISLNLIDNVKCKLFHPEVNIETSVHPLPHRNYFNHSSAIAVIVSIFVLISMVFLTSTILLFIIGERMSGSKHLQLMTELHPFTFWFAHFIWDFCICTIVSTVVFAILSFGTNLHAFSALNGGAYMALLLYNFSAIPFAYITSFIFKKPAYGFTINVGLMVMSGITVGTLALFSNIGTEEMKSYIGMVTGVLKVLPAILMTQIIGKIAHESYSRSGCEAFHHGCSDIRTRILIPCCNGFGVGADNTYEVFAWDNGSGHDMLYLFVTGLAYIAILALIESRFPTMALSLIRRHFLNTSYHPTQLASHNVDEDVLEEEQDVSNFMMTTPDKTLVNSNGCLVVHKLQKCFQHLTAVDSLSFKVPSETCFGLLGINGAGKTTTFSMLTGNLEITSGDAFVDSFSVRRNRRMFQHKIGFCPQFDALLELMTGEEMLFMFARLRGIPGKEIPAIVKALIKLVNLEEYASKPCAVYSGGNKRKLSIAVAIIGRPQMIFLDEPTAGIDPVSRRQIWELLTDMKKSGITVVLTSHSMEECEALCDKLTIMSHGRLLCIGSTTHLKSKYGQGFTILTKIEMLQDGKDETRIANLTDNIKQEVPGVQLKHQNLGLLTFRVANVAETLGHLFKVMEHMKKNVSVLQDYAITATTLEEVFIAFAKSR